MAGHFKMGTYLDGRDGGGNAVIACAWHMGREDGWKRTLPDDLVGIFGEHGICNHRSGTEV